MSGSDRAVTQLGRENYPAAFEPAHCCNIRTCEQLGLPRNTYKTLSPRKS